MAWLAATHFANADYRVRMAHLSNQSLALVAAAAVRIDVAYSVVATLHLLHRTFRLDRLVCSRPRFADDNWPERTKCRTAHAKEWFARRNPRCETVFGQSWRQN